ncbi:MAG: hypothetical protein ABI638_01720 [Ignavibacteriota bacterium]
MNLTEILVIISLISASALCLALIYFFYQIVKSLHSISVSIQELSYKIAAFLDSIADLSKKITRVINEIESQLHISKSIIINVKEHVDKILDAETKIRNGIENAVMPIAKNISAVGKGFGSFWKNYRNK